MRVGAKLAFVDTADRESFKHAINENTYIGAAADSGCHILGSVRPMCEYDTDSVISVLKRGSFEDAHKFSDKKQYYAEVWNC